MIPAVTVDIGTTSIKLGLFDESGANLDGATYPTPTLADAQGEIYDVEALTGLVGDFIRGLSAGQRAVIGAIAITGVGESGGLVRSDLTLASPMILWHDHRGAAYLDRLSATERTRVYEVTGLPVNANYALSKVAWAIDNAADARDSCWLNIAEYLAARLTGTRGAEHSLASRTLALDLSTGAWSAEIAGLLDVNSTVFPPLLESGGVALTTTAQSELGLREGVLVTVAGHDHIVGGAGAGLLPGELLNSTGTTEGLLMLRDSPLLDVHAEKSKLANGLAPAGRPGFTLFASIPAGGSAFATLQSMLGVSANALSARIADVHGHYLADAIDLDAVPIVLPWFRGSPPPDKNSAARGVISRVSSTTTADDIVLGTFLGMALQFRDVLDLFPDRPEIIKVIGPATRNPLWLRLKADLLGMPLSVSQVGEVVSRGAQALASGAAPSWDATDPLEVAPHPTRHSRLTEWADSVAPAWAGLKAVSG